MIASIFLAIALLSVDQNDIAVSVESNTKVIDPSRNVYVTLTVTAPKKDNVMMPDLRERVRGFSQTEDFAIDPVDAGNGKITSVVNWMLTPEPCAKAYKIAPFAVGSLVVGPIYFDMPNEREAVTGEMELNPKKDLPPLSLKLCSICLGSLLALALIVFGILKLIQYISRRVKEHRMSAIERAWAELDRLLQKGLPGRGRYKDFYIELTMVVRRYVQRKYGIKAPNLTTEEFLHEVMSQSQLSLSREHLAHFLETADLVKFAGVEATPDMADEATASAREYLKGDTLAEDRK